MVFLSQKPHILVVGDVMLDEYLWCDVERISPEAPIPIARLNKSTLVPGGAANVAHNLINLNAHVHLVGFCGLDYHAECLKKALKDTGISTDGLVTNRQFQTIKKSRILAQNQQMLRIDYENAKQHIPIQMFDQATQHIEQFLARCNAIILSDYGKHVCSESFCHWLTRKAQQKGIPLLVDPKGDCFNKYKHASLIKPNLKEFETVIKKRIQSEKQLEEESFDLIEALNIEHLIITRAEKGMSLLSSEGERIDLKAEAKQIADISGAGDTVIATIAWALSQGLTPLEATTLANVAAGIVVGKIGTASIHYSDLEAHPILKTTTHH